MEENTVYVYICNISISYLNSIDDNMPVSGNVFFNPAIRILYIGNTSLAGMWNIGNLSAPFWRLYWNNKEGAAVRLHGREFPLKPAEIMLIPPDTPFSSACVGKGVRQFHIHFTCGPPFAKMDPEIFIFQADVHALGLLKEGFALSASDNPDAVRLTMASLSLVTLTLMRISPEKLKKQATDARILDAMKILDEDSGCCVSNPELARKANMSTNAFLRLFKQHAGASPQLYSRNMRIDRACILLHYSEMDIKEIADETGFCDRYHFTKVFRRLRGETPCEFRRRRRT